MALIAGFHSLLNDLGTYLVSSDLRKFSGRGEAHRAILLERLGCLVLKGTTLANLSMDFWTGKRSFPGG